MKVLCFTKSIEYEFPSNGIAIPKKFVEETNFKITIGKYYELISHNIVYTSSIDPDDKYINYVIIDDDGKEIGINSCFFKGPEYWRNLLIDDLI